MNDSWDWIQTELRKIEEELPADSQMLEVVDAISVADFWKRRYDEEMLLWERKINLKEDEKNELKEKSQTHELALRELEWKLKELERRWEREKLLLEDRLKSKELEAEIHKNKLQWETRLKALEQENINLKNKLSNITGIKFSPSAVEIAEFEESKNLTDSRVKELEAKLRQSDDEHRKILHKLVEEKESISKQLNEKEESFLKEKTVWEKLDSEVSHINQQMTERLEFLHEREQGHFTALEDLARGFAHRVRNYLGIISGTIQLCLASYKMEDDFNKQLTIVDQNVADMLKSIEEFLALAKIPQMNMQKVALTNVVEKIIDAIKEKTDANGITVEKNFSEVSEIEADEKLLVEALLHLINNSLEAMPSGGKIIISIQPNAAGGGISIKITDTGSGISEVHLKKVFQPYFTTKKNKKGLGLTVAKRIADLHGATLSLESANSQGLTATITFVKCSV